MGRVRRFAVNARRHSPRFLGVGGCSLPCGSAMLRVADPHPFASA